MRRRALLWLACVALAVRASLAQRLHVEVTERPPLDARSNEINWEGRRPRTTQALRVGRPLTQQALKIGADALWCTLGDLQASTGYEVRVSHAGTIAATIRVAFGQAGRRPNGARRALLDVTKLTFRTDATGAVVGAALPLAAARRPEVVVTAQPFGAYASGPRGGGGFVLVDVALVPLESGLPADVQQLVPWLLACVLFAAVATCAVPVGGLTRHPAQRFWDKRARMQKHAS